MTLQTLEAARGLRSCKSGFNGRNLILRLLLSSGTALFIQLPQPGESLCLSNSTLPARSKGVLLYTLSLAAPAAIWVFVQDSISAF